MPTIQIVVESDVKRAIHKAAKARELSDSSFARWLLVEAMEAAGIVISPQIPKEQLPLIKEEVS